MLTKQQKQNLVLNGLGILAAFGLIAFGQNVVGAFLLGMCSMGLLQSIADLKGVSTRFRKADQAVSPVIGVILMVAITVILAAIVFVLVSNLAEESPTQTPHITMLSDGRGNYTVQSVSQELPWDEVLLTGGCMPVGTIEEFIHAGNEIHCNPGVKLTIVHRPSDSIAYRDD